MPINILRLNHAPSSHPNSRIAFIKPLPRPRTLQNEHDHASTFLYAIAAQCFPIMKSQHLSVTTLEEHEPNREFVGRNFNNGEIIQLVLRTRGGSWMSFNQVQMVMMHELAHNVQMNHAKAFWAERNKFAAQLSDLWARGYTGDGFWGSGKSVETLSGHQNNAVTIGVDGEVKDICGGTFKSRGKKRKRGKEGRSGDPEASTWRERRDRRIERKFGKNGVPLGEDEDARVQLEICRKGPVGTRPRVAGSKRGKELRAAAALKRLEAQTQDETLKPDVDGLANGFSTGDDDYSGEEFSVCDSDDVDAMNLRQEMEDFNSLQSEPSQAMASPLSQPARAPNGTVQSTMSNHRLSLRPSRSPPTSSHQSHKPNPPCPPTQTTATSTRSTTLVCDQVDKKNSSEKGPHCRSAV